MDKHSEDELIVLFMPHNTAWLYVAFLMQAAGRRLSMSKSRDQEEEKNDHSQSEVQRQTICIPKL